MPPPGAAYRCRASAPLKAILSGEHSVVHGQPALAAALGERVEGEFEVRAGGGAEGAGGGGSGEGAGCVAGPASSWAPGRAPSLSLRYLAGDREVWPAELHAALADAAAEMLPPGCAVSGTVRFPEGLLGAGLGSSAAALAVVASVLVFARDGCRVVGDASRGVEGVEGAAGARNSDPGISGTSGDPCGPTFPETVIFDSSHHPLDHPFARAVLGTAGSADARVHGGGSRLDATVVVAGGLVLYDPSFHGRPGQDACERLYTGGSGGPSGAGGAPPCLRGAALVVTRREKCTRGAVAFVRGLLRSADTGVAARAAGQVAGIGKLTRRAADHLRAQLAAAPGQEGPGDAPFFEALNANQDALRELGVSCAELEEAVAALRGAGWAAAKLTGAGQGGAVLALGGPGGPGAGARVEAALREAGGFARALWDLPLCGPGLRFSARRV